MEDRALNRLGEDADLLSTDTDGLLELLDDYLDEDDHVGKTPPSTYLKIQYYITTTTTTTTQHHTLVTSDEGMDGVEGTPLRRYMNWKSNSPSAEEIISAGHFRPFIKLSNT